MPKIKKPWVSWEEFEAIVGGTWTPSAHTHLKVDITDTPWAWADVLKTGSNLTDLATRLHSSLQSIGADDHHPQAHAASHHVAGADLVNHDSLTGFVANEHIDHTGVTMTAGSGLSGGGTIAANRTFNLGALTGNWDAGAWQIRALKFYSDQATGTAPLTVLSTTMVVNLNADRLHNCAVSGLTVGHVLKATAAAAIAFQANNLDGLSDVNLNKYKTEVAYDVLTRNSDGDWCAQEIETVVYEYPFKSYEIEWEFWTASPPSPWAYGSINAGSTSAGASLSHHPGYVSVYSGPGADSGYYWIAANNKLILKGKEQADFVFKTATDWANRMNRFGFQDSITIALPTDGAYFDMNGRYLTGKTRKAGVGSTTGTGYNTSASTWYRGRIIVNSNASLITFLLFDSSGTQLWTDSLAANIPTASTGFGTLSYYTAASEDENIITMDLAYLVCARGLVR